MAVALVHACVQISGMTCASCVHHIETEMMKQNGVLSASVALATSHGRFIFDSKLTGVRNIIEAVNVSFSFTVIIMCARKTWYTWYTINWFFPCLRTVWRACISHLYQIYLACIYIWHSPFHRVNSWSFSSGVISSSSGRGAVLLSFFHLSACVFVGRITQKVVGRFSQNLSSWLIMEQETVY